jgi:hypothetical protein|nr:MAG TPA: Protein of unknown function (DUF3110) [Caudoviricetes sp.]
MGKCFDEDCLYIIEVVNPRTNDGYILKNPINKTVAFEDRDDAIDYAKLYIRKRLYTEHFNVSMQPLYMLERALAPLQIIRRKVKNKEEK